MTPDEITAEKIDTYALTLIATGAASHAEDDLDEDGVFEYAEPHEEACDLALAMVYVIRTDETIRTQLLAAGRTELARSLKLADAEAGAR